MSLVTLTAVGKSWGADRRLFSGVSLVVHESERLGLIGANGSGKSTLLRVLAGLDEPDEGERVVRRGLRVGYLEQEPQLAAGESVRALVRAGIEGRAELLEELEGVHDALAEPGLGEAATARLLGRQERLQARLDGLGGHAVEHVVERTLEGLGLGDPEALAGTLSGGERRRVALARLLVREPDLLLLDEPTNHLDAFVVAWLEERLRVLSLPLVLVTHDRYLLDRVVDRIVELDQGGLHAYEGGYARYLAERAARLEAEARTERSRLNLLRRETEWMRRGPPARSTKAKARIARHAELAAAEPPPSSAELALALEPGTRLGEKVVRLRGVSKRYGERVVLPPLDLELARGMRLGVLGPNGAGKSTLLGLLLGRLEPTSGTLEVGETVRFATIDQERSALDPERTVVEEVAGPSDHVQVGERRVHVAGFLDRFLFPGPAKEVLVRELSGGERARVLLAKLLLAGGNVLVLDEPTNDLDLPTLRALEEALVAFEGSVVVVSHDRWFLDRVATHVLLLDGRGGAQLRTGDASAVVEAWITEHAREAAQAARRPRRAAPSVEPGVSEAPRRKPLAPWERRELEELTGRIAEMEAALAAHDAALADPGLWSSGPERGRVAQERRTATASELDTALARWESLAERDA